MLSTLFKFYPPTLSFFLSHMPAAFFEKRGRHSAINNVHKTYSKVPAYKAFLDKHQINISNIKTLDDFKKLPLLDKENYLQKYPLDQLCTDGDLEDKYIIDGSSGYGGKRSYWPRLAAEDNDYPFYMELIYRQFFHINKRSTLMIITLGLGVWIGGEKTSWASRQIAIKGRNKLTVITPGMQFEEILEIIKKLGPAYEQVILIGYPLYVKRIIDEGVNAGIDWQELNVKLGLGGEGYSEAWREHMARKIGLADNDLIGIGSIYGAAELGMTIGREAPMTVLLRKLAYRDKDLAEDLFGQWNPLPSFCQYNPNIYFIEQIDNELIFTTTMPNAAMPVIRYNIHDRGGVLSYSKALEIASDHGHNLLNILTEYGYHKIDTWQLPLFYVWGRSGQAGSVSIFGLIVYTETIKDALESTDISRLTTGNFVMDAISDKEQYLQIKVELIKDLEPNNPLKKQFVETITKTLEQQNTEYRELRLTMKDKVLPKVLLLTYRHPEVFDPGSIKHRYKVI